MKRILLLAVCLAIGVATAQAQPRPHYADMYEGNKQIGKQWASGGNARLERLRDDGTSTVMIYRADSAKIYTLRADRKIYMVLPMAQSTDMNALIGAKGNEVSRQFEGMEVVDGKECSRYTVTTTTTHADGSTETVSRSEWWWEPLNTFIKQQYGHRPAWELRSIVQGAQPASLFEIPRDYTAMNLPVGGLMEMFEQSSGRSQSEIKQAADDADKGAKSEIENMLNKLGLGGK